MQKVYVCIPTYNEAQNIVHLLDLIQAQSSHIPETYTLGVIVIDDNSPDGTGALVEQYRVDHPHFDLHCLHNERKAGLGKAYVQAFLCAIAWGAFAVLEMDADFSHDPRHIPEMLKALQHADLVIGSRYIRGGGTDWTLKRKLISLGGNIYSRLILWKNLKDFTGGFNLYKTEIFQKVPLADITSDGYSFQIELKYKTIQAGYRYKEIPIFFQDRQFGQSKLNNGIVREAIKKPWKLRFS